MKINIKRSIILIVYILILISAFSFIQYRLTNNPFWTEIRYNSNYIIVIISIIFLLTRKYYSDNTIVLMIFGFLIFDIITSAMNSLFLPLPMANDLLLWPLVFSFFYCYAYDDIITDKMKKIMVTGAILIIIAAIPTSISGYSFNNGTAVFTSYYAITFLSIVFMSKNKKLKVVSSIIVCLLMILTQKRGAFLSIVIATFVYYIIENANNKEVSIAKRLAKILLFIIIFSVAGFYIVEKLNLSIIQRLNSMFDDGGSGRMRIWECVFNSFMQSSQFKKVFGHGFHAVYYRVQPFGISRFAHNSFLEILYDYGIIGLLILIFFIGMIIAKTIQMLRNKSEYAPIMTFTIFPTLLLGFVSYFFEQSVIIVPFCVVWGICIGLYQKDKHIISPSNL